MVYDSKIFWDRLISIPTNFFEEIQEFLILRFPLNWCLHKLYLTFVAFWGILLCRLTYFGSNVLKWPFFLTHSTQYPVQEITNLEATAEVKIWYTDHLADGPWWLQAVCTSPSKWLVRMKQFLHDWIPGIKLVRKIL